METKRRRKLGRNLTATNSAQTARATFRTSTLATPAARIGKHNASTTATNTTNVGAGVQSEISTRAATKKSLQTALDANRFLQTQLIQQLATIQEQKQNNRSHAATITARLVMNNTSNHPYEQSSDPLHPKPIKPKQVIAYFRDLQLHQQHQHQQHAADKSDISRNVAIKFKYQSDRKWTMDYFVDPTGSKPNPNSDVTKRQQLCNQSLCLVQPTSNAKSTRSTKQPRKFTKEESLQILELVHTSISSKRQRQQQEHSQVSSFTTKATATAPVTDNSTDSIDWNWIVNQLNATNNANTEKDTTTTTYSAENDSNNHKRSIWECFTHYRQHLEQKIKIAPISSSSSSKTLVSTTPSSSSKDSTTSPLTLQEDEVLFRYLALHGPQFVWDTAQANHVASRLFPNTTARQLLNRSNQTAALNPNLATAYSTTPTTSSSSSSSLAYWKTSTERKLVLLMKIYHCDNDDNNGDDDDDNHDDAVVDHDRQDSSINNNNNNNNHNNDNGDPDQSKKQPPPQKLRRRSSTTTPLPKHSSNMSKVASHFPDRTRQQISHKWERSLDPSINHAVFTPEEDELLRTVVREALDKMNNNKNIQNDDGKQSLTTTTTTTTTPSSHDDNNNNNSNNDDNNSNNDGNNGNNNNNNNHDDNDDSSDHGRHVQVLLPPRIRDIAHEHFPHRKPHQVYGRWLEIATTEDLVQYHSAFILLNQSGKDSSSNNNNNATLLFSPNDFRLEMMEE